MIGTRVKALLALAALLAAVLVAGTGVAWAANVIECQRNICEGTEGNDDIQGTRLRDEIFARGGDDVVRGLEGADYVLVGGSGDDRLVGGLGGDGLEGGLGRDVLIGGAKNDVVNIREQDDSGSSVPGTPVTTDRAYGGANADVIVSDDGQRDFVDCGPNPGWRGDRVAFDRGLDEVVNCEELNPR